jgi:hypothetical protein
MKAFAIAAALLFILVGAASAQVNQSEVRPCVIVGVGPVNFAATPFLPVTYQIACFVPPNASGTAVSMIVTLDFSNASARGFDNAIRDAVVAHILSQWALQVRTVDVILFGAPE